MLQLALSQTASGVRAQSIATFQKYLFNSKIDFNLNVVISNKKEKSRRVCSKQYSSFIQKKTKKNKCGIY